MEPRGLGHTTEQLSTALKKLVFVLQVTPNHRRPESGRMNGFARKKKKSLMERRKERPEDQLVVWILFCASQHLVSEIIKEKNVTFLCLR